MLTSSIKNQNEKRWKWELMFCLVTIASISLPSPSCHFKLPISTTCREESLGQFAEPPPHPHPHPPIYFRLASEMAYTKRQNCERKLTISLGSQCVWKMGEEICNKRRRIDWARSIPVCLLTRDTKTDIFKAIWVSFYSQIKLDIKIKTFVFVVR